VTALLAAIDPEVAAALADLGAKADRNATLVYAQIALKMVLFSFVGFFLWRVGRLLRVCESLQGLVGSEAKSIHRSAQTIQETVEALPPPRPPDARTRADDRPPTPPPPPPGEDCPP
jgi:hypothetical protein